MTWYMIVETNSDGDILTELDQHDYHSDAVKCLLAYRHRYPTLDFALIYLEELPVSSSVSSSDVDYPGELRDLSYRIKRNKDLERLKAKTIQREERKGV